MNVYEIIIAREHICGQGDNGEKLSHLLKLSFIYIFMSKYLVLQLKCFSYKIFDQAACNIHINFKCMTKNRYSL